ncbi:MAG: CDP-diacylglycerol--glycerol-3-phosphate 3-phosphatidyltransferase [Clostridia bacterium]|nr:CDP-diacylglycerol--glycerol-3-phosphate 3-phosphatidyltransferase [Clostridia bacterium]
MNLPNKLTIARMIMTPIFLATLIIDFKYHLFVALAVFGIASFTDMLDGNIARKQGLVTDFGKFLDPIADKILTTSAFVGFLALGGPGLRYGYGMVWILFIILTREFAVASIRMIAAGKGKVVAADKYGKIKTVLQMFAVVAVLFVEGLIAAFALPESVVDILVIAYNVILWASTVLTVISGINYLSKNREFIDHRK